MSRLSRNADPETGLTEQQRRFADEYLTDYDARAAYQRAGYKGKNKATLDAAASRLLAKPEVRAYLKKRTEEISAKLGVTQEAVIGELVKLGFFNVGKCRGPDGAFLPVEKWDADATAAIAGIEFEDLFAGKGEDRVVVGRTTKVKLVNKTEPLVKLGQHLGMFAKNVKLGGTVQHEHKGIADVLAEIDGAGTGLPAHGDG